MSESETEKRDSPPSSSDAPGEPRAKIALPVVVCRKLRTKTAFGTREGAPDWREGLSTTAVYWCLKTMESFGPDDRVTHAHDCRRGRACFVDPDDGIA